MAAFVFIPAASYMASPVASQALHRSEVDYAKAQFIPF